MPTDYIARVNERAIIALEADVKNLKQFRRYIDQTLHTAKYVAAVLGLLAVLFGGFMKYVNDNVKKQKERIERVEKEILVWEKKVNDAVLLLDKKKKRIIADIEAVAKIAEEKNESKSKSDLVQKVQEINSLAESKKKEISTIGIRHIMRTLQDGSSSIVLKKMIVMNKNGQAAVSIGTDSKGNGSFVVMSKEGKKIMDVTAGYKEGIITVYNHDGITKSKVYKY